MSASALLINPNVTGDADPFPGPLLALSSLWYPAGLSPAVVPLLYVLSGVYAISALTCLANIGIRFARNPFKLVQIRNGFLVPNTANVMCGLLALYTILAQPFIWTLIRIYRDEGSYHGLVIMRGLAWYFLALCPWSVVWGLTVAALMDANERVYDRRRSERRGPTLSPRTTKILCNTAIVLYPIILTAAVLTPLIWSEMACSTQFDDFKTAQKIAMAGHEQWEAGAGVNQTLVMAWDQQLGVIQESKCIQVSTVLYRTLLVFLVIHAVGTLVACWPLSRRLSRQIRVLRRSARALRRLEDQDVVPQKHMPPRRPLSPEPPKPSHHFSNSFDSDSRTAVSVPLGYDGRRSVMSASPFGKHVDLGLSMNVRGSVKQEMRADALRTGQRNLYWRVGAIVTCGTAYIALDGLVVSDPYKAQTSHIISPLVNLGCMWIWAVICLPPLVILLILAFDPSRQTFLGIPLQTAEDSPDVATTTLMNEEEVEEETLAGPPEMMMVGPGGTGLKGEFERAASPESRFNTRPWGPIAAGEQNGHGPGNA